MRPEELDRKRLGDRIRKLRTRRGLTQKALAERAGLSESALRSYELGDRHPKDAHMERIAKALDVRPETFADCRIRTDQEVIHLIFNLEDDYGILPLQRGSGVTVDPKSQAIAKAFRDWGNERGKLEAGTITQEEYEDWKDSYSPYTHVGQD